MEPMAPKAKRGRPRVARDVEVIKSLTLGKAMLRRIDRHAKQRLFDDSRPAAIRDLLEKGLDVAEREK